MGKGKNIGTYKSVYDTRRNERAAQKNFSEKKEEEFTHQRELMKHYQEEYTKVRKHSLSYYSKRLMNSDGFLKLTRRPETMDTERKKQEFFKCVLAYEGEYQIPICEVSKIDLRKQLFQRAETHSSFIVLLGDARQFDIHKISLYNIVKIFLYKLFYPQIFDFDIVNDSISFNSQYIEDNFDDIFLDMERLFASIVFDGALLSLKKVCTQEIMSYGSYTDTAIDSKQLSDFFDTYIPDFDTESQLGKKTLMKIMLPSMAFVSRMYYNINKSGSGIRMTTLFSKKLFYKGKRSDDARAALYDAVQTHKSAFDKNLQLYKSKPFSRLMNAAFANDCTGIYDLEIMQNNVLFKPYLIDGFITKFVINEMIHKNGEHLQYNGKDLELSAVPSNPNYIIRSITSRDYEVLSEILNSVRTTMEKYYFTENLDAKKDKLISAEPLLERIHSFNSRPVSSDMNELISDITLRDVDLTVYNCISEAYFSRNECEL